MKEIVLTVVAWIFALVVSCCLCKYLKDEER